jgi:hypothetical protein
MDSDIITKISAISIPIVIISYNNHKYVENTIKQLRKVDPKLVETIVIMDNCSTCNDTILYLNENAHNVIIIRNKTNNGPRIAHPSNKEVLNILPERFILTDPDLEFNLELPTNFIEILGEILDKYPTQKAGFAISVEDHEFFYPYRNYIGWGTIYEWESRFWKSDTKEDFHSNYHSTPIPLYHSLIDTTFALYAKSRIKMVTDEGMGEVRFEAIRVAGCFTCRHLPFYMNDPVMSIEDRYKHYSTSKFSTTSQFILRYIEENYRMNRDHDTISFTKK